ncbi:thiol:disulfide interchange protein DsbD [Algoriphagus sp. 4150]|uniref:protein-disulfide reductase DsbD family protein n=1 Tax=Algoriphagus sp. 4150 TaxID=2817756 RepID=UPI0028631D73|nr:protein-disulfide reductase DsbD domain-containing protein [Algoriphagus sp. 4150]MDR7129819.1 thiol:disulfide interchange protein DsbD [Algoriphagus sp. 4150]
MTTTLGKSGYPVLLALLFFSFYAQAQIIAPPKWTISIDRENLSVGEDSKLVFEAEIPAGWYIYANDFDPDLGPLLTILKLDDSKSFQLKGGLKAIDSKTKYEEVWEGEVKYFIRKGRFEQAFIPQADKGEFSGTIEYQMCSDLTGQCVNYEEDILLAFTAKQATNSPASPEAGQQKAEQQGIIAPPKWLISIKPKSLVQGEKATLVFEAQIPIGWYIYANDFDPKLGPILTTLKLDKSKTYELIGDFTAIDSKKKYEDIWKGDVKYFIGKGKFEQAILLKAESGIIQGALEYQMCNDVTGKCTPPYEEDFELTFTASETTEPFTEFESSNEAEIGADPSLREGGTTTKQSVSDDEIASPSVADRNDDNPSMEVDASAATSSIEIIPEQEKESLWGFMVLAFLAGLAALLTPCVFPMIPMTVSFFTGRAKSKAAGIRNAAIYGFSIIAIYTVAGTAVAAIQGPEFANWLATHWLPNLFFFGVFIFFALAFLGMFEITLPSGLVNKVDEKAEKGGLTGIFFMAFTLVLVSFSCTGPIVGSILISSAGGELVKPILGMFAFSLAFAIPFTLFAIFPEWMNRLPKSGGWLNSVKVVLGFLELALAFKFLSIADLVYHWGILDRDIFLIIWIVIFGGLGLYLLGKIRLPHDSPSDTIGVPRLLLALLTFMFVLYMIPGLFGAPLKYLSGFLPPMSTQQYKLTGGLSMTDAGENILGEPVKYADIPLEIPHGIQGYFDYEQAMRAAKKANKPLLIDFTGHGCVNCRKMEENVWVDAQVLKRLKEDFVMVALYIDERLELPESDWYTSEYDGKVKKTMGKQNADFQITRFKNNAQPYYVILDHNGNLLAPPKGYDTDIQAFVGFLDGAKERFRGSN